MNAECEVIAARRRPVSSNVRWLSADMTSKAILACTFTVATMTLSIGCSSITEDLGDMGESAPRFKQSGFPNESIGSGDQPVSQAGDSGLTSAAERFNLIIDEFRAGSDDKVAQVTVELMPQLQTVFRANCMLLGMITNHRIGKYQIANRLAIELDRRPTVWDLPGIPDKIQIVKVEGELQEGIEESRDVTPIIHVLDSMKKRHDNTDEESLAIDSLLAKYAERQRLLNK